MSDENNGGGAPPPNGQGDPVKPITMADIEALFTQKIPTMVNATVATHLKRTEAKWEKALAAMKPKPPEGEGGGDDDPADPQKPGAKSGVTPTTAAEKKPESNPEVEALRKELARIQRKQEQAEQAAKAEARRRVELEGYGALKSSLAGKVVAGSEDIVLAALRGRGAITITDDGDVRLKLGGKDEPEDGFDLSEGITTYLKTQEAKFFLPAPASGTNGGRRPLGGGGINPTTPADRLAEKTGKTFEELL